MSDMKLTVQCMQHESVIAHTYACSVDAVALWPDNIANAIKHCRSNNLQAQTLNDKCSSNVSLANAKGQMFKQCRYTRGMGINSISMKYQFKSLSVLRGQRARIVLEGNNSKDAKARLSTEV